MPYTTTKQQNRMPPDKQQNAKPFTPSLSSNFRSAKSPLTPRLAGTGSGPTTPASAPRREAFVRSRSPGKEEQPAPGPLGGNITPRSAARKSRIGTESPSTTPTSARTNVASPGAQSTPTQHGAGIASPLARGGSSLNEVVYSTASPTPLNLGARRVSGANSAVNAQQTDDAKFFRADDARPVQSNVQPKASPDPEGQFFFVGTSNISSPKISPIRTAHAPVTEDKFFHASEARPQKPVRPELQSRTTGGSTVSARSARPTSTPRALIRSTSPTKSDARPQSRGKDSVQSSAAAANVVSELNRRGSIGSSVSQTRDVQSTHKKTMSASSVTSTPSRKLSAPRPLLIPTLEQRLGESLNGTINSTTSLALPTASPESLSARSLSLGSQISERSLSNPRSTNGVASTRQHKRLSYPPKNAPTVESTTEAPLSPISPPLPATTAPSDPAVQARRERKVLDLEISNSSLLAINKTLERELRKQNTELRRFRRLSRSGRLSVAPAGRNISNSTLGTLAEIDDQDSEQSASDLGESDDEPDDDLDLLSNSSAGNVDLASPATSNGRRARQRARDEKRLMLDLSKHQQLLLDSQKLSQSIRRCLTCTEELIRDGEKALDYKPDIHVGGRVLNNDELHYSRPGSSGAEDADMLGPATGGSAKGLLSPGVELSDWLAGGIWVSQGRAGSEDEVAPFGADGGGNDAE